MSNPAFKYQYPGTGFNGLDINGSLVSQIASNANPYTSSAEQNSLDFSSIKDPNGTGRNNGYNGFAQSQIPANPVHSYGLYDMFKGGVNKVKDMFTPTSANDSYSQMQEDWKNGIGKDYKPAETKDGIVIAPASGVSFDEYTKQMQNQQGVNDHKFSTMAGVGMGAVQTGLGILNYFDQKAMNKKNMALMDQQIANNADVMATRTARAADIKKYFG